MGILRKFGFDLTVAAGCVILLAYFAWHGWQGSRGFSFRQELAQQLESLKQDEAAVIQRQEALESKVALMRPERVDPDMLEELARSELMMVGPDEVVVIAQHQN